jgi:rhodanese-related sulfurtransferase
VTLPELTGKQLRQRLAAGWRPWLVHVGTASEFADAHLPGAVHLPAPEHLIPLLETGDPVVLYAVHADRERVVAWVDATGTHGNHLLWHYVEGLAGWMAAGFPVEP